MTTTKTGEVFDFQIFGNNIAYNDIFGICLSASTNNSIYDNDIHHNGDGAFGWNDTFYWRDDYYKNTFMNGNTLIKNNKIHYNRRAVFVVNANVLDNIVVEGNNIMKNGGNPIHYEYYEDYDMVSREKDWEYNKRSEILILKNEIERSHFKIGINKIDESQTR